MTDELAALAEEIGSFARELEPGEDRRLWLRIRALLLELKTKRGGGVEHEKYR